LVEKGDVNSLYESVLTILADDERKTAMKERCQEIVKKRYDIRFLSKEYIKIYRGLLP
jgi:glycosyltransferase involved in cell wall biosynthesis